MNCDAELSSVINTQHSSPLPTVNMTVLRSSLESVSVNKKIRKDGVREFNWPEPGTKGGLFKGITVSPQFTSHDKLLTI